LTEKWRALVVIGEPGEMEARLRRYEGVFRWFLMRVEPLRDETGKIVRGYGTCTDIETSSKQKRSSGKRNASSVVSPGSKQKLQNAVNDRFEISVASDSA
jgi:hypothetical protein